MQVSLPPGEDYKTRDSSLRIVLLFYLARSIISIIYADEDPADPGFIASSIFDPRLIRDLISSYKVLRMGLRDHPVLVALFLAKRFLHRQFNIHDQFVRQWREGTSIFQCSDSQTLSHCNPTGRTGEGTIDRVSWTSVKHLQLR